MKKMLSIVSCMNGQQISVTYRQIFVWGMLTALFLLLLVSRPVAAGEVSHEISSASARVGLTNITADDIVYYIDTQNAFGNNGITNTTALVALVNASLKLEVARLVGAHHIEDEIFTSPEYNYSESQTPEVSSRGKEVFGADRKAYERIYLSPKIANRKLRYWYSRNEQIHKRERERIEQAYTLVRSGRTMRESANETDLEYATITNAITRKDLTPALEDILIEQDSGQSNPVHELLDQLEDGELYADIVENNFGYRIIKRISKDDEGYTFEQILVRKEPFFEWFAQQSATLPVIVQDKDLKERASKAYPSLWWLKD